MRELRETTSCLTRGILAPEVDLINPSKNDSTEGKMSFLTLQPLA